uniref:Tetratricopeptide repeat protein 21B n=1 Tax=Ciona savignyi TaxID=51511 RepID=H2Y5V1_CIOSA
MASEDLETLATLNYHMLEGYYRHVQMIALDATRKFGSDPVLVFYKALGMLSEGRIQESMNEIETIKDKPNVILACNMLMSIAQNKLHNSGGREGSHHTNSRIKERSKNATEFEFYLYVVVLWFLGPTKTLKEAAEKMVEKYPDYAQGVVLRAWVELTNERGSALKKSLKSIDAAMTSNSHDPMALLLKSRYLIKTKKHKSAIDTINQAVISFPNFTPAPLERARIYLMAQDYDQMLENIQRVLAINPHHPEALRLQIFHLIGREGKHTEAVNRIGELIQVIDRFEPQNADLYYRSAKLFSRICGGNQSIIKQTYTLVERAVTLDGTKVDYANEMAFQLLLMGQHGEAAKCYRNAMNLDESSVTALLGILRCQLLDIGSSNSSETLHDVKEQVDFVITLQDQTNIDPDISYLKAVVTRMNGESQSNILKHLSNAEDVHSSSHQAMLNVDFFTKFNPHFKLQLVQEYLKISPSQPIHPGQVVVQQLARAKQLLSNITNLVPGLLTARYLSARVLFLSGDALGAISMLQHCLKQDSTYGEAHLLLAQVYQHNGNHSEASQCLEAALSYDFELREHPLYHLIKAISLKESGQTKESIQTLKMALALPGVKRPSSSLNKQGVRKEIATSDRMSIFLELVEAHTANNEQHEAAKVMQDAMIAFQGTPEEMRVKIANAELAVTRGDIEQALSSLNSITPDQPFYAQAKEKMAHIYLHHRKDKKLFTSCYRELVKLDPSPHACLLLGDAYMSIQEPEKAIEVYEKALKKNPSDTILASKIGQALIKTHDFKKAITYYETALKNGKRNSMRYELAELLIQLENYDKAERVLLQASRDEEGELETAMNETRRLMLLATLYEKSGRHSDELDALTQARDTQARVLKRVQMERKAAAPPQAALAASICAKMAQHCQLHENDTQQAIKYYKEALVYDRDDTKVILMLDLARLYLSAGDLDSCQQNCMAVLRQSNNNNNDQASMMMADVMFNKKQYNDAIYHYEQLLSARPNNYEALARLIVLLRRGGRLRDTPKYLELAKVRVGESKVELDAGYQYCNGLYQWYCGKANAAVEMFNLARCDSDWSEKSLENMIRICLNPDKSTVGGEAFENVQGRLEIVFNGKDDTNSLSTAERLIKEFKTSDPFKVQMLDGLVLVATKHKPHAERALAIFLEIAQKKNNYVPAILGMAVSYVIMKQTPKARNQLKRIVKMQWTAEEADEFEHAWLLLADLYIQASKYDMALELLKKCLEHNQSCCKAYEYSGFICEKQLAYKDAASHYEKAWEFSNHSSAVIGYKLAFNYLKAKRNSDAIDIAHQVLATNPNYPRLKKDILDKARASIRI